MLNSLNVMGRLTADPVRRTTQSGIPVTTFSVACQRDFKNASGEREVDYIDCVAWRNRADFVDKHFKKGQLAVVSGRLQLRDYTGSDGIKRRVAELVADSVNFADFKPAERAAGPANPAASDPYTAPAPAMAGAYSGGYASPNAGDLPF